MHETPQWICVLLVQRSDCLFIFAAALLSQWMLGQPPWGAKSLQPFPVWHHCVSPNGSMMRVLSAPWVACAKYSVNMGVRRSLCWMSLKGDFWCSVTLNATLAPLNLMQPNCNLTTIRLQQLIFANFKELKDDSFHWDTDSNIPKLHSEFQTIYRPFCNEKTKQ